MGDLDLLALRAHDAVALVAPTAGGRLAQLTVAGTDLLVPGLLVAGEGAADPMMWGSFPMVPWAGRVRRGRFEFAGRPYELPANLPPHAIHGTAFERRWQVTGHDDRTATLVIDLAWPLGGSASQSIALSASSLTCELVARAGAGAMPAEVGWHPWFVKPDSLAFAPTARYVRDADGIPTGELIELDHTDGLDAASGPYDDCFVNTAPVELRYGALTVTLTSDCDHWVLYDEPHHATCVEPQSGPPDAFTIRPRHLPPHGELRRRFTISW